MLKSDHTIPFRYLSQEDLSQCETIFHIVDEQGLVYYDMIDHKSRI